MSAQASDPPALNLHNAAELRFELNGNGSLRLQRCGEIAINLFVGNEVEGGPANLYLRRRDGSGEFTALLGPRSPSAVRVSEDGTVLSASGEWQQIRYTITLRLAAHEPAWFWHVALENAGPTTQQVDLICVQDIALAPYSTVRLNEYYVSQYVDHTALAHERCGYVVASRQNQAASGRHPWCLLGSLRHAVSFATDALQVYGLNLRGANAPAGIVGGLPGERLQHEHSMVGIQDDVIGLPPGARAACGFFGEFVADHPAASSEIDLARIARVLALPEAVAPQPLFTQALTPVRSHFSHGAVLSARDFDEADLTALFGTVRRHEERSADGQLLSFFLDGDRHVVLRAKEQRVLRPHGHILRTGDHLTADESALTSTTWMTGVFHSMLTQGHVSFNRLLSTVHSYLGLFRSHGQRVFAEIAGEWRLLDLPSAYEMTPHACRWLYRYETGLIEVRSVAQQSSHELTLELNVRGAPLRFLIAHHIAVNGDDGSVDGTVAWSKDDRGITVAAARDSEMAQRFPQGRFRIVASPQTRLAQVGGDELLFLDGLSRSQPFVCLLTEATTTAHLTLRGELIADAPAVSRHTAGEAPIAILGLHPPSNSALAPEVSRLADIMAWFNHNALVHYLSPRGLEQYSGGGWGTRDVSQGPVELLLSQGRIAPVRDLLLRVMSAQNGDGDWPQWFMFFERDRAIRAGDSHGDIVFWPVLALAQYLLASGDATVLDEEVPYFEASGAQAQSASVWQHVQRALAVIEERVIGGTALAAYGHGDWNDALQPADPSMRRYMCSAWTVTLHYQTLTTLASALRSIGRDGDAVRFDAWAQAVHRDFQKLLVIDNVLTGYVLFEPEGAVRYLLHPRDAVTGVQYSALAMIHALLEGMLTPDQARTHLQLLRDQLSGPDGVRLFDRPLEYHGGPQRYFQRAESATFFGREIGLMYMHAHLRYAQALALVGDAQRFFHALCQVDPIGLRELVATAALRQSNCYYSSSDAAFRDRYHASAEYHRVAAGDIALEGGWRVYSSGAGIALSLIVRRFLGLSLESRTLDVDPVIPAALDGMIARVNLLGHQLDIRYRIQERGCAVRAININGRSMALAHVGNPYRVGAARIERGQLLAALNRAADNTMEVFVC